MRANCTCALKVPWRSFYLLTAIKISEAMFTLNRHVMLNGIEIFENDK